MKTTFHLDTLAAATPSVNATVPIEEALAPLHSEMPDAERHRLALAIRSATGIESLAWLTDVAGLSRDDATDLMRWSARALLQSALADRTTGPRD